MSGSILPGNVARMPALSIRQPWAWLIVNGFKPIENRDWLTRFRGEMLVHAGKKLTVADYDAAMLFIEAYIDPALVHQVPDLAELPLGGIVGLTRVVDCVRTHPSPWFTGGFQDPGAEGGFGFVLEDSKPLPFIPWKGRQGFFDVVVRP